MKQTDIIISGAGIAGLTLSLLLAQAGLQVALIEPFPPNKSAKPNGRTIALMNSSLNIIKSCNGIWDKIAPQSCPMEQMKIFDISRAVKEPIEIEFPASEIGLGQFGYNIPNALLRNTLYDVASKHEKIEIYDSALSQYERTANKVIASLENGTQLFAPLVVGADGRNSKVREVAGINVYKKTYDQAAMTCIVNHSRAHENTSTEFHKPNGPLAFVPLPGNQSSIVWVETRNKVEALKTLNPNEFIEALENKSSNFLGGMTLETQVESWPLCSIKANTYTAPRCALIAEAAHVMSPITAQGLNLSLRDVAALAETLIDTARLGLDIGSATMLKTYEKRRSLDIETRVFGVDAMNKIVSSENKKLKDLRRIGLKSLDVVPALKTLSMHIGLAPQMDEGRLARGEAL